LCSAKASRAVIALPANAAKRYCPITIHLLE
jgi:hypothetical protein